ncbi:MAG: hypothetical protein QXP97_06515 [Desulfurococcus sp.]|jgi:hypothetical protein|uniref:hypothetical protein n=1 Tax=Thermoprotei TaxID=183924 RepID=UPI003169B9A2
MEHECDIVAVWSPRETVEVYKECGISKVAYDIAHVEVVLSEVNVEAQAEHSASPFPSEYIFVKNTEFTSPRIFSSYVTWIKIRCEYVVEKNRVVCIEVAYQN